MVLEGIAWPSKLNFVTYSKLLLFWTVIKEIYLIAYRNLETWLIISLENQDLTYH